MFYNPHGFSFLKLDDSKIKRFIYKLIEKSAAIINNKCTIVGCSYGEYEEARKLNKNSICINNGIDIRKLEKEVQTVKEKDIDINNLKICTSGRIGFQKNPDLFNEIAKSFPNIQFNWIGDGELKHKLTSDNIKITGWLKREDVLKEVSNNDIFILPSLWEGLPISLLEAMYLNKVCIVSNVIGNKNVIQNEKNGFVCDDLNQYIEIIKQIQIGKRNLKNISDSAKRDIVDEYNVDVMTKKYVEIYKK